MNRNMKAWKEEIIDAKCKKPMPILSFPSVQLMGVTVRELVSSSELQARGMKLVADRTPSLASLSLMDLSVEAEAFGSSIHISDNEVPTVIGSIVSTEEEANSLTIPKIGTARTGLYIESVRKASELITDRPVFAGVIGPYSLAGRLMDVSEIMILCYDEADMVHTVLEKASDFLISYCRAYKAAGANGVVMAEPLAGLLSPSLAKEFAHPYAEKIISAVQDENFSIIYHNCGDNVKLMTKDIYALGAYGYHFGDAVKMEDMLPDAPGDVLVMGNVSPSEQLLCGTPESVRETTLRIMEKCCVYPNFVISSGCDIPPMTPWENLDSFFRAAADFYSAEIKNSKNT